MKKLIVLFVFLTFLLKSQVKTDIGAVAKGNMYSQLLDCKNDEDRKKMLKNKVAIGITGDAKIDAVFKYWAEATLKGNYVLMNTKELQVADGKKYTTVSLNTTENSTNFTYKHSATTLDIWSKFGSMTLHFDAMKMNKSSETLGVDKSNEDIANKLLQFLMVYTREITADDRQYRMGQNILMGSSVKTVLKKTILVPQEYLNNGLKKEDFGTKYKFEFLPAAKIAERFKNKDNLSGYAQMFVTKIDQRVNRLMVIDLETCELIAVSYIDNGEFRESSKPMTSDAMADLIKRMEKVF